MAAQHLLLAVTALTLLLVSLHDIAARTIPNGASLLLLLLGGVLRWDDGSLPLAASLAFAVFSACTLGWRFGLLGGGDVKLLGAAALLIPPGLLPGMLAAVALWGGVLAAAYLLLRWAVPALAPRSPPVPAEPRRQALLRRALRAESWRIRRRGSLPYGSAIAAGVLTVLFTGAMP